MLHRLENQFSRLGFPISLGSFQGPLPIKSILLPRTPRWIREQDIPTRSGRQPGTQATDNGNRTPGTLLQILEADTKFGAPINSGNLRSFKGCPGITLEATPLAVCSTNYDGWAPGARIFQFMDSPPAAFVPAGVQNPDILKGTL